MSTAELRLAQRRGAVALAGREVKRVVALWTQTILPPAVTALLFLAVFGGALGDRIEAVEGVGYSTFILPGLLVMTVAGQAFANNSTSLYQAKSEGYIDDILTSPLRPWHLAAAFMAGGLVRALGASVLIGALALPFAGGVTDPLLAGGTLALTGLLFAALGVITGIWAETFDQHSFIASLVVTPLALVGGVFYAAETLPEPWQTLTRFDPLYYLVDGARSGFTGFHETSVWLSLPISACAGLGAFAVATALLARGWRLKP